MGSVTHVQLKKRKKISEAQKGRKLTDEHREKLSKAAQKDMFHVPMKKT